MIFDFLGDLFGSHTTEVYAGLGGVAAGGVATKKFHESPAMQKKLKDLRDRASSGVHQAKQGASRGVQSLHSVRDDESDQVKQIMDTLHVDEAVAKQIVEGIKEFQAPEEA